MLLLILDTHKDEITALKRRKWERPFLLSPPKAGREKGKWAFFKATFFLPLSSSPPARERETTAAAAARPSVL